MINKLTLKQITLLISVVMAIVTLLALYIVVRWDVRGVALAVVAILISGVSFLLVYYMLQQYVFKKLKVIYKIIRSARKTPETGASNLEELTLDAVSKKVSMWARESQEERSSLAPLENYRKDFAANVSHELKTPIFAMQGYLHTLMDGALHDEKINEKYLGKALQNLERLQNIVSDLETISRMEAEEVMVSLQKFNIKALCEEIISDNEIITINANHKITLKNKDAQNLNVLADRSMIHQVLVNLVTNSIKYNNAQEPWTRITFYDLDKQILVEVADNGIGIDQKHIKHLFDRFYRVDASRSRALGGSGLGLSIVKHIVEAHGQTINVRSTPGQGSTFGFTLKKA